nr:hypothetical protein [Tanacetum cinerariifolium]
MIMYLKNVDGFRLDYFKGMSYDDIRPVFKAKFNSNIEFLSKSKEQLEEEENRAIESINETLTQKAAKRRKLNKEVEDLKQHLEIVSDEDVALMDDEGIEKKAKDAHVAGEEQVKRSESVTTASVTIVAVPVATITAALVRVAAASTRRRK